MTLHDRIEAEIRDIEQKVHEFQDRQVREFEGRQERLEQFATLCDQLDPVWRPRLETLAEMFRDRIQVTPGVGHGRRSATFRFNSNLAQFNLTFTAMTDEDVRHLVLDYALDILPILMNFEKNAQLILPLDAVNPEVVGDWIDDRIIEAVKTYSQLHQNANYLKGHLVRDPIANIEFPKYAAAAEVQWRGKTYHFIGEQTRDEFLERNKG
jgi:YHS domain-containing protein